MVVDFGRSNTTPDGKYMISGASTSRVREPNAASFILDYRLCTPKRASYNDGSKTHSEKQFKGIELSGLIPPSRKP